MLAGIRHRYGLEADGLPCGDRIYTDVAMARNAGALGVLVLSERPRLMLLLIPILSRLLQRLT